MLLTSENVMSFLNLNIFDSKHCLIIPNDTTFICQIREDLKNNFLDIGIQGQLKSHHQVQDFSINHA
jgi:hypothetical protein